MSNRTMQDVAKLLREDKEVQELLSTIDFDKIERLRQAVHKRKEELARATKEKEPVQENKK